MISFMLITVAFLFELQESKNIYRLELNRSLHEAFDTDLKRWKAQITPENIVRFNAPFEAGSDQIPESFIKTLDRFVGKPCRVPGRNCRVRRSRAAKFDPSVEMHHVLDCVVLRVGR